MHYDVHDGREYKSTDEWFNCLLKKTNGIVKIDARSSIRSVEKSLDGGWTRTWRGLSYVGKDELVTGLAIELTSAIQLPSDMSYMSFEPMRYVVVLINDTFYLVKPQDLTAYNGL